MGAIATAGDALLADIIANPADDGLRLIYADWLEEFGDEPFAAQRAELIRAIRPMDFENTPGGDWVPAPGQIGLLNSWINLGRRHLVDTRLAFHAVVTLRRGFVDGIRLRLADWLAHGKALAAAHPLARVEFSDMKFGRLGPRSGIQKWPCRIYVDNTPYGRGDGIATYLPAAFGPRLKRGRRLSEYGDREYETDEEAIDDLSDAAIAVARAA